VLRLWDLGKIVKRTKWGTYHRTKKEEGEKREVPTDLEVVGKLHLHGARWWEKKIVEGFILFSAHSPGGLRRTPTQCSGGEYHKSAWTLSKCGHMKNFWLPKKIGELWEPVEAVGEEPCSELRRKNGPLRQTRRAAKQKSLRKKTEVCNKVKRLSTRSIQFRLGKKENCEAGYANRNKTLGKGTACKTKYER